MVLKGLILNSFYIKRYNGLQKTDFQYFSLWEGLVVLEGLILDSFQFEICSGPVKY